MNLVKTSPTPGENDGRPEAPRDGFHDAVVEQEHVMTTHLAVIEGWLGMLEDDSLNPDQRRRAATVMRQRTESLRLDLCTLLRTVKQGICLR